MFRHEEIQKKMKALRAKKRFFELEGAHGEMYENRYLLALQ